MNEPAPSARQLGEMPHFLECGLCLLPRRAELGLCPFCQSETVAGLVENLPAEFALRLVAEGRWDAAAAYLENEVAGGRETAPGCLLLAWISLISNDLRAVEIWCHESLRLEPSAAGPHILLGLVFERGARWEESAAEYGLALSLPLEGIQGEAVRQRQDWCRSQIPEW